jgi:hypothetical protein
MSFLIFVEVSVGLLLFAENDPSDDTIERSEKPNDENDDHGKISVSYDRHPNLEMQIVHVHVRLAVVFEVE